MTARRALLPLIATLLTACTDRETDNSEQCYPENPDPGAMVGSIDLFCGQPLEYRRDTPDGVDEDAGPYTVFACGPRSEGYCDLCPAEDLNALVREHLIEVMSQSDRCSPPEVQHIVPECVTVGDDSCCINAWYWGSCNIKG